MVSMFLQDHWIIILFSVTYCGSSQLRKSFYRQGKKEIAGMTKIRQRERMILWFFILRMGKRI
jgi:hypothetical protein